MTPQPMDGIVGVMPAPTHICSTGHRIFADGVELEGCPRTNCAGTLRRVGIGSRSAGTRATTFTEDDAAAPRRPGPGTASSQAEEAP